MKKLIAAVVLTTVMSVSVLAQESSSSTIWAVHHITPKNVPGALVKPLA